MPGIRVSRAVATILAVLALALGLWTCATPDVRRFRAEGEDDRTDRLYRRHCAVCHGDAGAADTEVADLLFPRPRAFSLGLFKLASTDNGIPSERDLVRTLRRGMPGSAMTSFGWMDDDDLQRLAGRVRELAVEGVKGRILEQSAARGEQTTATEAQRFAALRMDPGEPLDPGPPAAPDPGTLARGRHLYLVHCAACHGEDGSGREPDPLWAGREDMQWPRNFTAGILRGGAGHRDLYWRIAAGMPGVLMPPTRLPQADMAALVVYVQSLIPEGEPDRLAQPRREITVPRVRRLPESPEDPIWDGVPGVRLALAPLWWWKGAVQEVDLAALHDGERLVIRATWVDPTCNDRAIDGSRHADGFALQFSGEEDPPLFTMGSREEPVTIWHWKAFRFRDVAGILDLLESDPHVDVPVYTPAPGNVHPSRHAEAVQARGYRSVPMWSGGTRTVAAVPSWERGRWSLLMTRSLAARDDREISLQPGSTVHVACAVWEGGGGDRGSHKAITPWHRLRILP